jgi:hypothetical protein
MDAPTMLLGRRGWGIHAVRLGAGDAGVTEGSFRVRAAAKYPGSMMPMCTVMRGQTVSPFG